MTFSNPKVTVLMPVYNAKLFLDEAISSILEQTFKDFEFIIIDDGSTDSSPEIIKKWSENDDRIRLYSQSNQGIVHALNSGIRHARGKYIARMDADDIALPGRLDKQYHFLEEHRSVGAIASRVRIVDEHGKDLGDIWPEDKCLSYEQILQQLPISNCIAHPSVMVSTKLLRRYGYRNQLHAEDADLWLRMLSDGVVIEKLPEKLLMYRVHPKSITQSANRAGGIEKQLRLKKNYLTFQIKNRKWGKVENLVLGSFLKDKLQYESNKNNVVRSNVAKTIRKAGRIAKQSVQIPSIQFEKRHLIKHIESVSVRQSSKQKLLVILPWMTVGGADKVMLDLTSQIKSTYDIHFITTEPELGNEWHDRFAEVSDDIVHLPGKVKHDSNKPFYISRYCEHHGIDKVLISNSISGYKAAKAIHKQGIKIVDILHGEGGKQDQGGAPKFMQPYESYIDRHITVTEYLKHYLETTYQNDPSKIYLIHNGVDVKFFDPNAISIPQSRKILGLPQKGKVFCWIGRFSEEKQPEVFLDVAIKLSKLHKDVYFVMGGDGPLFQAIEAKLEQASNPSNIVLLGQIENARDLLEASDALVITSSIEGLPIVLLEAGSMGVPVFAPTVGGIPEFIKDRQNGVLLKSGKEIENDLFKTVSRYIEGEKLWKSKQIREYTVDNFSLAKMKQAYLEVLDF